jgi:uncharacterized protein YrrD
MMQFRERAIVTASDGKTVGNIDRVVIDARTYAITALVIDGGELFAEKRVVSLGLVRLATEDEVRLTEPSKALKMPRFEARHYLAFDELDPAAAHFAFPEGYARPLFTYLPVDAGATEQSSGQPANGREVALQKGVPVVCGNGQRVGTVDCVFADRRDGRVTHLLISKGEYFEREKLVPVSWVRATNDEVVRLGVSARALAGLPDYAVRV